MELRHIQCTLNTYIQRKLEQFANNYTRRAPKPTNLRWKYNFFPSIATQFRPRGLNCSIARSPQNHISTS